MLPADAEKGTVRLKLAAVVPYAAVVVIVLLAVERVTDCHFHVFCTSADCS
jgi:hypothetical protein